MKMKCLCVSNSALLSNVARRKKPSTQSFFKRDFGTSKSSEAEPKYYDNIDLPFPPSLLSKTFLKGIYVGGDKVVHFGVDKVVMTCLNCFLDSGSLHRYQYEVSTLVFTVKRVGCTTQKSDPPPTVIARALYLLREGFGEYNLLTNNCEVFAFYCKTGRIVGRQAEPCGQVDVVVSTVAPRLGPLMRLGSFLTAAPCASADTMDFGTVDIVSAAELQGIACASCLPSN